MFIEMERFALALILAVSVILIGHPAVVLPPLAWSALLFVVIPVVAAFASASRPTALRVPVSTSSKPQSRLQRQPFHLQI